MKTRLHEVFAVCLVLLLVGCAPWIKGFANSALYKPLPSAGTFKVEYLGANDVEASKLDRILVYQFKKLGYKPSDSDSADLKVSYSFNVISGGSRSGAIATTSPQTHTIVGNTIVSSPSTTTVIPFSTNLFVKRITVKVADNRTGDKLWESSVEETGWCNQIFVTAPYIFGLMFDDFPEEATNRVEAIGGGDPRATEFKKLYPKNTNWNCK